MKKKQEIEFWKKLFGERVESFTEKGKYYTVFLGKEGWECSCPDFTYRKGSWSISYEDPETGHHKVIHGCKHIAKVIETKLKVQVWRYKI